MFTIKNGLCWVKTANPVKAFTRSYRFGNRAMPSGYHVTPRWFEQKVLEQPAQQSNNLINQDGRSRIQNRLFDDEVARQKALITRIEKIEVLLEKPFPKGEDILLMMNKDTSTPFDCAKHVSEMLTERSALALVNGKGFYHMHQPLDQDPSQICHLRLLHFKHEDCMLVNEAFWRSCSMLLGSVISNAFKNEHSIEIVSPLSSDVRSGSFVCDAKISSLPEWNATDDEKRILTSLLWEATHKNTVFERLQISPELAKQMFADSPLRLERIEASNTQKFTVYRLGSYVELCGEPLISNSSQIGSIFLSAVYPIKTAQGQLYRFQGIALPKQLAINPYTFSLIRERSERLNSSGLN